MFKLSLKTIMQNKSRMICTVIGIFIATVIIIIGTYYLYVSNEIVKDNFETGLREQRVLLEEVFVSGTNYYAYGDEWIVDTDPIGQNTIFAILTTKGVTSIEVMYERLDYLEVSVDEKDLLVERPIAIDAQYSAFSSAMVNSVKKQNSEFEAIIAGEKFDAEEPFTAMISESTLVLLNMKQDEIIGKEMDVFTSSGRQYSVKITGVYANEVSGYYNIELTDFQHAYQANNLNVFGVEFIFNCNFFRQIEQDAGNTETLYPSGVHVSMDSYDEIDNFVEKMNTDYSLSTVSDYQIFYKDIQQQSKQARLFITLGVIVLVLSLLMIFNTMLINISQQKPFMKLLRLLGYTKRRIHIIHVLQSLIYGAFGSGAAFIVAYIGCTVVGFFTVASFGEISVNPSVFMLPIQYALAILGVIMLMSGFIGFIISLAKAA